MRTSTLLATAASLSLTTARIVGFYTPSTLAPDSTVKLFISAQNDIQASQDVAFSFGLAPSANAYPGTLGTLLDSKFLGPDFSNTVENITHYVHIPATTKKGKYVLSGAQFSLFGVSTSPTVVNYQANVTVGSSTSSEYVFSTLVTA